MSLSKGRPIRSTGDWEQVLGQPVEQQGLTIQGGVMQTSPVKSGALRRGWNTTRPSWQGRRFTVKVGNNIIYAHYQNTRTRNKGYVKAGIDQAKGQAKDVLMSGIRERATKLWKK
jgi:hypothetical protein